VRFFFLIFLQALVLNHIYLGGLINPYLYIYFILLLPFSVPGWMLLVSAFLLGAGVDLFTNTLGLNAASCVLMAFFRPLVINLVSSDANSLIGETPSVRNQGVKWFVYYAAILTLIHHFALFYLEVFRFSEFLMTFLRVVLSAAFTMMLIMISEYLLFIRKQ
jgi:hypothetical protein